MIENTIFVDLEDILQEEAEVIIIKHNKLIDKLEKLRKGALQPPLQLPLFQWLRLRSIGDLLESRPKYTLKHHFPKFISEELTIAE